MSTFLTFHPSVSYTCQQVTTTPENSSLRFTHILKEGPKVQRSVSALTPMISSFKHPWGRICNQNQYWSFLEASCLSWNHLDFVLLRVALGKLRSIWGNLFLQLRLLQYYSYYLSCSMLSQVVLGAIVEMLFVSFCECSAVWWIGHSSQGSHKCALHGEKRTQMIS